MTNSKSPAQNRLKTAAVKAAVRAAAAKERVREAKAQLKATRKVFKAEKKAAKSARRKLNAASQAVAPPKSARTVKAGAPKKAAARRAKPRTRPVPETMRSAAEVAKSVIERLHAPPPILPPEPVIPASGSSRPGEKAG